jgi:hypothetical protein
MLRKDMQMKGATQGTMIVVMPLAKKINYDFI